MQMHSKTGLFDKISEGDLHDCINEVLEGIMNSSLGRLNTKMEKMTFKHVRESLRSCPGMGSRMDP